jgi:hypothetical protein
MDSPLMQREEGALSRRALLYYRQSKFVHAFAKGDFQAAFDACERIVDLLEHEPHLVEERPENYVISLQNLVMMSTFARPLNVSRNLIDRLRQYAARFPGVRFDEATVRKVPVFAANIELRLLLNHKLLDEAAQYLPAVLAQLEEGYAYNVNEGYVLVDLYFMAASLYLQRREDRQALQFVNKLIHMEGLNADYEYFLDARILHAVILFETQETQLLEYALSSTQRYLQQKKKLFRMEKKLIDFLRKSADLAPGAKLDSALRELHRGLKAIQADPDKDGRLSQFDWMRWLESRIES